MKKKSHSAPQPNIVTTNLYSMLCEVAAAPSKSSQIFSAEQREMIKRGLRQLRNPPAEFPKALLSLNPKHVLVTQNKACRAYTELERLAQSGHESHSCASNSNAPQVVVYKLAK